MKIINLRVQFQGSFGLKRRLQFPAWGGCSSSRGCSNCCPTSSLLCGTHGRCDSCMVTGHHSPRILLDLLVICLDVRLLFSEVFHKFCFGNLSVNVVIYLQDNVTQISVLCQVLFQFLEKMLTGRSFSKGCDSKVYSLSRSRQCTFFSRSFDI